MHLMQSRLLLLFHLFLALNSRLNYLILQAGGNGVSVEDEPAHPIRYRYQAFCPHDHMDGFSAMAEICIRVVEPTG